jgi:glycosyltransferase involved in cell wall biosynthesis
MAHAEPPPPGSLQPLIGCTIARAFELPQAIVLATSFLKFHPSSEFAILLLDGSNEQIDLANIKLLSLGDLGLEEGDEWRLPMLYSAEDLASILKPALLRALLKSGAAVVAYFEVATVLFDSLPDILREAQGDQIIATEAVHSSDQRDLGRSFIAVGRGAEASLHSWSDRLQEQGFTTETSTGDEAKSSLEAAFDSISPRVISFPGFAVGYWNLNPENFAWTDDHYEVGGEPLRSFDFRGYDPLKPHLLSKYQGPEPRILLSEHAIIARLCDDYQRKVVQAGYDMRKRPSYRSDNLSSGLRIDHRMRNIYRDSYRKHRLGVEPEPPSPFGPRGGEGFLEWLNEPLRPGRKAVSRYMLAVYNEREDIHHAFPDPIGSDAGGFRDWYLRYGQRELDLPAAMVPSDARPKGDAKGASAASLSATPVNVAGYFRAELGLATAARSLLAALEAAEIPFNTILFEGTANRQTHPFAERRSDTGSPDINIICVNADKIASLAKSDPELWHGRYTIGLWFWEVEDFPAWAHGAFNYVDEVWVASEFVRETFRKVSPKPVFKCKLPVLRPEVDPALSRADLGLPDRFVFLFSFDFLSVLERKNPLGLIKAFTQAFQPDEGPVLVIKTINGEKQILEMEKLRYAARGRSDIILMDGYVSAIENSTLTALSDCYVSLHRSEGFGLTIAEAMALGKPAIATAYSGNLEFMTEANSYLCPFQRCEVGPENAPYPVESHWSEPDLEAATALLRHVYSHQQEARGKGLQAAEDMRALHSPRAVAAVVRERLTKIRYRRSGLGPIRSIGLLEDRLEELQSLKAPDAAT